jgi:hypothetical protein
VRVFPGNDAVLLGIRVWRIPRAMVLEHPDEFARKIVEVMGTAAERAKN